MEIDILVIPLDFFQTWWSLHPFALREESDEVGRLSSFFERFWGTLRYDIS